MKIGKIPKDKPTVDATAVFPESRFLAISLVVQ